MTATQKVLTPVAVIFALQALIGDTKKFDQAVARFGSDKTLVNFLRAAFYAFEIVKDVEGLYA